MNQRDSFIGAPAVEKRANLNLSYPIVNGEVTNWEDMEKVWEHIFTTELKADPTTQPVFLTE
jgi:actin-related protein